MELKELVKKVTLNDLKTEAKKHSIPVACRTKMDIAKDLLKGIARKTGR